jgi:hypothetical protein
MDIETNFSSNASISQKTDLADLSLKTANDLIGQII